MDELFSVSQEDWSLHRKGEDDQLRHQQKIRETIANKLPELISNENLILSNGKNKVYIPIRSLDEHRFRYSYSKQQLVGSEPSQPQGGDKVGQEPGDDRIDSEISIEEIDTLLFANLGLPDLRQKSQQRLMTDEILFNDIRKTGILGNLDKKRTLLARLRRETIATKQTQPQFIPEDLRFKTWQEIKKPRNHAVIFALMDTSGSMGPMEKFCARSFFFWMSRFLRTKYEHLEIVYIAHHTQAKVVSEDHFFTRGESGGTICSSAYALANALIQTTYPAEENNLYLIHFSDGDNLMSDNPNCVKQLQTLVNSCNLVGYSEVNPYNRTSTLMYAMKQIENERFRKVIIRNRNEVYQALCTIFSVN